MKTALLMVLLAASAVADEHPILDQVAERTRTGAYAGVTAGIVSVGGSETGFEAYAPGFSADDRHDIRSATKSITAVLIGELIESRRLRSVRTPVAKILPDAFAHLAPDDDRRDITVEDALTMRTGLACNDWAPASLGHEDKMYKTDDWVEFLLNQPLAYEVGEHFSYCTGGVILLGRVIEALAAMTVPEFANERLFGPLGIEGARWEETPTGHTDSGGHLRLRLSDLHRIGLLMLNQGQWRDERLITRRWFGAMTEAHTPIPERRQRYGYLWWLDQGNVGGFDVTLIYAHGNGGNFILIVPELDLVGAFTGANYGKPEQFTMLNVFTREIVPALIGR